MAFKLVLLLSVIFNWGNGAPLLSFGTDSGDLGMEIGDSFLGFTNLSLGVPVVLFGERFTSASVSRMSYFFLHVKRYRKHAIICRSCLLCIYGLATLLTDQTIEYFTKCNYGAIYV